MRAVLLNEYGDLRVVLSEVPRPEPKRDEVLLKVEYGGLRWGDIMQCNGYPAKMIPTPYILGQEAAGVVEAVGADVQGYRPGQRVVALTSHGGWADYVCVPALRLLPVPDHVSLAQALIYPVNLLTAYYAVMVWGKVQPGESVLLHSAAGGVGLLALQIMKRRLRDVRVIALVGNDEKARLVREHGADHVINYKATDYVTEVERLVGAKASGFAVGGAASGGVDVSLNGVSGATLETDPRVIRKRGRWVIYGWSGGGGVLNTAAFGYDGITIMPFSSIAWMGTAEHMAGIQFVGEWLQRERLLTPTVYPLKEAARALQTLAQGDTIGKVVLQVRS